MVRHPCRSMVDDDVHSLVRFQTNVQPTGSNPSQFDVVITRNFAIGVIACGSGVDQGIEGGLRIRGADLPIAFARRCEDHDRF